jgi:hypothetical protein
LALIPENGQKKTPEESFGVRHSIWRAMPLLLAKRRALFRRELNLYRPHCCFCGNQPYAEKSVIYGVNGVVEYLTRLIPGHSEYPQSSHGFSIVSSQLADRFTAA